MLKKVWTGTNVILGEGLFVEVLYMHDTEQRVDGLFGIYTRLYFPNMLWHIPPPPIQWLTLKLN